ncbi:MAG TPA: hypothetical protein VNI34_09540 [Candidatus Nitrosotalea sp.]|nr:hypothetical protein [Candidatus Nitrosotalea sp.]
MIEPGQAEAVRALDRARGRAPGEDPVLGLLRLGVLSRSQAAAIGRLEHGEREPRGGGMTGIRALGRSLPHRRLVLPLPALATAVGIVTVGVVALAWLGLVTDYLIAPWRLLGADNQDLVHLFAGLFVLVGCAKLLERDARGRAPLLVGAALMALVDLGAGLIPPITADSLFGAAAWGLFWAGVIAVVQLSTAKGR